MKYSIQFLRIEYKFFADNTAQLNSLAVRYPGAAQQMHAMLLSLLYSQRSTSELTATIDTIDSLGGPNINDN